MSIEKDFDELGSYEPPNPNRRFYLHPIRYLIRIDYKWSWGFWTGTNDFDGDTLPQVIQQFWTKNPEIAVQFFREQDANQIMEGGILQGFAEEFNISMEHIRVVEVDMRNLEPIWVISRRIADTIVYLAPMPVFWTENAPRGAVWFDSQEKAEEILNDLLAVLEAEGVLNFEAYDIEQMWAGPRAQLPENPYPREWIERKVCRN